MNPTDTVVVLTEETVDFAAAWALLRRRWWVIALTTIAALLIGILVLHSATYRYTSTMVISPAQTSGSDGISSRLGSLGGLASAVGVSLPEGGGGAAFKLYVEGLKSYDVAQVLARDPDIMHHLFFAEWDAATRQWRRPQGAMHGFINAVKDVLGIPNLPWQAPDATRLQTLFETQLMVEVNARSPVVIVRFEDRDPAFANRLLERINSTTDGLLRARAILRTNDYIAYLNAKLRTVELTEQRQSITQTLDDQERIKMAESSTRPFAAEVFSGPSATSRPTSPKPYKLLLLAMLGGVGLGVAIVLLHARRRSHGRAPAIPG